MEKANILVRLAWKVMEMKVIRKRAELKDQRQKLKAGKALEGKSLRKD